MREIVVFSLALWFASYKLKGKRNFERCTHQTRFAWKVSILENDTIDIVSNIPVSFICLGNGPPFSRQLSGARNDGFLLNTLKTLLCYPGYRLEAF